MHTVQCLSNLQSINSRKICCQFRSKARKTPSRAARTSTIFGEVTQRYFASETSSATGFIVKYNPNNPSICRGVECFINVNFKPTRRRRAPSFFLLQVPTTKYHNFFFSPTIQRFFVFIDFFPLKYIMDRLIVLARLYIECIAS